MCIKIEGEIKIFPDLKKLREFVTRIQEILKEIFKAEMKTLNSNSNLYGEMKSTSKGKNTQGNIKYSISVFLFVTLLFPYLI